MDSLRDFFLNCGNGINSGVTQKNNVIKRNIVAYMAVHGDSTLSELTKELNVSVPTITKLVNELVADSIVTDLGKVETPGGRRPNVFGLADSAVYFVGVEVSRDSIRMAITDLKNNIIKSHTLNDFALEDTVESMNIIIDTITDFVLNCGMDKEKMLGVGVCIVGRINASEQKSYKYFSSSPLSLKEALERSTGLSVLLENNARARCYAEYFKGNITKERNVLYLHLGRGIAIGVIIDGKLYYGKSGFAGEFGHTPFFDNEIICACGKKGCLETEVSGIAIENKMISLIRQGRNTILKEQYEQKGTVHINDIIRSAKHDDNLSIELIEQAGAKIGKSVAFLINIFNPELVVVGGNMSKADDYLMLPMQTAINKYSLSLVYNDTKFRLSEMDDSTGAVGVAMLIRNKIIGL